MNVEFCQILNDQERRARLAQLESELAAIRAEQATLENIERRANNAQGLLFLMPQAD